MKRISLIILVILVVAAAVALVVLKLTSANEAQETAEPTYIWKIDLKSIQWIEISLEKQGMSEAWVKHDDQYFYFDEPNGSIVDIDRWGGGVPLLLSGPAAKREIVDAAYMETLDIYGLAEPSIRITIKTGDGKDIEVELGDQTPDTMGHYIKLADSSKVFTVDYTWYDIMENLVLDPPYPKLEPETLS